MFKLTNPHPQGKLVGDCVKRAITIASEINYHDIAVMLNRYRAISGTRKFNNRDNWKEFLTNVLGASDKGNMQYANNGARFIVSDYARHIARYQISLRNVIVQTAKHIVALDSKGNYYDTWDSGEKSIYKAWTIPPYELCVANIKKNFPKLCKGLTLERYVRRVRVEI